MPPYRAFVRVPNLDAEPRVDACFDEFLTNVISGPRNSDGLQLCHENPIYKVAPVGLKSLRIRPLRGP